MAISRTIKLTRTTRLAREGSSNSGAGKYERLPVGINASASRRHRAALRPKDDRIPGSFWEQFFTLEKVYLWVYKVGYDRIDAGSAPRSRIRAATEGWQEGTATDLSGSNATIFPGPSTHAGTEVRTPASGSSGGIPDATGRWVRIEVTAPAKRWAPARLGGSGLQCFGLVIAQDNDDWTSTPSYTSTTNNAEFASDDWGDGSKTPYLEFVGDDNRPPRAPTILSPIPPTGEDLALIDALSLTLRLRAVDDDVDDWITGSEVQVWTSTATMDADGIVTGGTLVTGLTGAGQLTAYTGQPSEVDHVVSGFTAGQRVKVRARTRDRRSVWGPNTKGSGDDAYHGWTELLLVELDRRPGRPTNLVVDATSPSPDYRGTHNDPDGGAVAAVETQVAVETSARVELVQNTTSFVATTTGTGGMVGDEALDAGPYSTRTGKGAQTVPGGTDWTVSHDGRALVVGERVRRRHRTVDQFGRVGIWSDWISWTVGAAEAPIAVPAPGIKQDTLTPAVGASHVALFDRLQVRAWASRDGGTQLLDTGEVTVSPAVLSKTVTWGAVGTGTALQWGQTAWVERRVRDSVSKAWTPWSPREPMPINSLPQAPTMVVEGAIQREDGTWVVGTLTPRLTITFRDADLPNDAPSRRIIRFRPSPTGDAVLTSDISSGITSVYDVPSSSLSWETTYWIEARYADSSGFLGTLSAQLVLLVHQPPEIVTDGDPESDDPTPTLAWTGTYHGDAAQASAEISIRRLTGYRNRALASNPDSYWGMGEASGTAQDLAGAVTGTVAGTVTRAASGPFADVDATSKAIALNGGQISFGDVYDFAGTAPFTIMGWAWFDSIGGAGVYGTPGFDKESTSGWRFLSGNGSLAVRFYRYDAGGASDVALSPAGLTTGAWHHIAAIYDGATITVLLDAVAGTPVASTRSLPGNSVNLEAGTNHSGSTQDHLGRLAEWGIWSRAWTPAAVAALLASSTEVPESNEVHRVTVLSAAEEYGIPSGLLSDGAAYEATVLVCDTLGLCVEPERELILPAAATFTLGAMTLTAAASATTNGAADSFTRSTTDGWGSADTGGAWTLLGTAADFDTDGSVGTIVVPAASATRRAHLPSAALLNASAEVAVKGDKLAVGNGQQLHVYLRYVNGANHYLALVNVNTDQTMRLYITRVVAGAMTILAAVTPSELTHAADTEFHIAFEVAGTDPTTLRLKVWEDGDEEPGWHLEITDSTAALQVAGAVGLGAYLGSGTSNAPVTFTFDDYEVS